MHPQPPRGCCEPPALGGSCSRPVPPRGAALKPEEALADAREKCAGEVQHRTSFPKALDGDRCRDSRPEGPPVTPSPPPRALAAVPQKAWLAWPRGQSRGGRAGWTVSVPSARQGWGGPRERGKVRGVFSAVRSPPAARGTGSTQAGARKHADACVPKRAAPKKLLGGGEGERGRKKKEEKKQRKVLQSFAVSVLRLLSLSRRILLQVVIARLAGIMPRLCPELIHVERVLDERNRWCEREPLRPPIFPPSSDNLVLFGRSLSDPCTGAVTDTALRL